MSISFKISSNQVELTHKKWGNFREFQSKIKKILEPELLIKMKIENKLLSWNMYQLVERKVIF